MAWFEKAKEWMTPERALAFQGIGMGLSQLDAGQPVNLSPVYEALDQRKQQAAMRKMLDVPGIMDSFTPQQQAVIAAMPEGLATQVIMEHAFKAQEPVAGVNVGGNLVNPYTGEVMYAAPGEAPKPIEVGGVLLDPVTMQPIFDSRTADVPATPMTPEERARWGIPETDKTPYKMTENGPVAIGGGGTSVTVDLGGGPEMGKLSTDYAYLTDPVTGKVIIDPETNLPKAAPVPGSPAAIEAEAAKAKGEKRDTQTANSADIVLQDINKAIEQTSGWTAGMGSLLSGVPGSGAADLQSSLDTIVANIGFDRLQQMREASPTGGALGGIAVPELVMLQAVLGSLKTSQSPDQLKANLTRLKEIYEPIAAKAAAYPNAADFGFSGGTAAAPAATVNTTPSGDLGLSDDDMKYLGQP